MMTVCLSPALPLSKKNRVMIMMEEWKGLANASTGCVLVPRELVKLRYYQDLKPRQISLLLGLSVANIYKAMSRIHGQLLECMSGR